MTTREINKGSIVDYLAKMAINPARKMKGYNMYYSPIRPREKTPSFKVSIVSNLWVDFGINDGGTLIDLILKLNPGYTVSKIVADFNTGKFSFQQLKKQEMTSVTSKIKIVKTERLQDCPDSIEYLKSRGIDFCMVNEYVCSISYDIKNKIYKGIASKNINGGYNINSLNFKCATKQGATLYDLNSKSLVVTEGIMDLLSFIMIYPEQVGKHNFCVLNSVNNLKASYYILENYEQIICFLDNDKAGDNATESIKIYGELNNISFFDYRVRYKQFKDLNDYLLGITL